MKNNNAIGSQEGTDTAGRGRTTQTQEDMMNEICPRTKTEPAGNFATVQDHPDAALLALQRELDEANAVWEKAANARDRAFEEARMRSGDAEEAERAVGYPALEEAADELMERIYAIEMRIASTPAHSFVGLAIKLRLAGDCICPGSDTADVLALISAQRDAERLAHAV